MKTDLYSLFGLSHATATMRQEDIVVDAYTLSGAQLRRRIIRSEPWMRGDDFRDMLMTFSLVFVGAMMFLID